MSASKRLFEEIRQLQIDAEDGNKDPLFIYIELDKIEKVVKDCKDKVKDSAIKKADDYGQKQFEAFESKIELSGKTTWDFKHIPAWNDKKKELTDIEETAKSAALNANKGIESANIQTGEVVIPAVSKYSTFLKIQPK
jgi:hypothetical protein